MYQLIFLKKLKRKKYYKIVDFVIAKNLNAPSNIVIAFNLEIDVVITAIASIAKILLKDSGLKSKFRL